MVAAVESVAKSVIHSRELEARCMCHRQPRALKCSGRVSFGRSKALLSLFQKGATSSVDKPINQSTTLGYINRNVRTAMSSTLCPTAGHKLHQKPIE